MLKLLLVVGWYHFLDTVYNYMHTRMIILKYIFIMFPKITCSWFDLIIICLSAKHTCKKNIALWCELNTSKTTDFSEIL